MDHIDEITALFDKLSTSQKQKLASSMKIAILPLTNKITEISNNENNNLNPNIINSSSNFIFNKSYP